MSDRLKALREKRGKLVTEMRVITETAETEKRDLTKEELAKHDELFVKNQDIADQVQAEERQIEVEREAAARADEDELKRKAKPGVESTALSTAAERQSLAFKRFLALEDPGEGEGAEEFRALQADADVQGGYLVAPEQFVQQLIKFVDDMVHIRSLATVYQVPMAQSLGVPSLDTDVSDADWTSELAVGSEDSSMGLGKRELHPHPLAKLIKVSNKLLRMALIGAEGLVMQRLAYKFAVTEEKGFLTGTGAGQPLGVFTASADGISTGRDVATGNSTTAVTFDGLIESKYSVKAAYWPRAEWMFHRDTVKMISKLKDGEGQYLWRPSVREGEPDRILNAPMRISEFAPNTFTTGLYVGIFGDFTNYWIADSMAMQVQRLIELYAATNQVGFIGRLETDGMPVLEEAFARVTLT